MGSGKLYVARSSLLQQTQPKRYIRYQRGHILGRFFFSFASATRHLPHSYLHTWSHWGKGHTFCRSLTHSRTSWCMEMPLGGFLCRLLRSASGYPSQWIHSERQRRTNNGSVLELRTSLMQKPDPTPRRARVFSMACGIHRAGCLRWTSEKCSQTAHVPEGEVVEEDRRCQLMVLGQQAMPLCEITKAQSG